MATTTTTTGYAPGDHVIVKVGMEFRPEHGIVRDAWDHPTQGRCYHVNTDDGMTLPVRAHAILRHADDGRGA